MKVPSTQGCLSLGYVTLLLVAGLILLTACWQQSLDLTKWEARLAKQQEIVHQLAILKQSYDQSESAEYRLDDFLQYCESVDDLPDNKTRLWFSTDMAGRDTAKLICLPEGMEFELRFEISNTDANFQFKDALFIRGGNYRLAIESDENDQIVFVLEDQNGNTTAVQTHVDKVSLFSGSGTLHNGIWLANSGTFANGTEPQTRSQPLIDERVTDVEGRTLDIRVDIAPGPPVFSIYDVLNADPKLEFVYCGDGIYRLPEAGRIQEAN